MGDTLVSFYAFQNIRLYTTRDSRTGELAVWALNFSEEDALVELDFENLPHVERATLRRLADKSGTTTLHSANFSSEMPGGRAINVEWTSTNVTGQDLSNFQLNLPAATLSLLVIEPGLEHLTPALFEQEEEKWFRVTFPRLPHASDVRYRLLGSENLNLTTWEIVAEVEAGTSEVISITDPQPVSDTSSRFYRVGLVRD